jgi:hypothetical protein
MTKLINLIGMTAGGWLGWALGSPVSLLAAFLLSMVGTGAGLYAGILFGRHLLS